MAYAITVAVDGHESSAELTAEQVALLDLLIIEGATAGSEAPAETRAAAARWAVETLRQEWLAAGEQDGPGA